MKSVRKILSVATLTLVLLVLLTGVASMQTGPGTPTLVIGIGTDTACTGSVEVPVTLNGLGGSGAAGFTVLLGVPVGTISIAPTCVGGPAFTNPASGCFFFSCTVVDVNDHGTGLNLYQIDGVCAAGSPPSISGDQLAATITVNRNGAPADSHVLDAVPTDGAGTFTQVFDPDTVLYNIPDSGITDGAVNWCPATAVTMSGFDAATNNAAPFAAAAWPLLAGAAAVAAGGAYALLRRKS